MPVVAPVAPGSSGGEAALSRALWREDVPLVDAFYIVLSGKRVDPLISWTHMTVD